MQMSQMHYLPLAPGFFAILVGIFFIVLVLRSVRYAYESLGVSSNAAIFLLFATLIGSIFNIPIAERHRSVSRPIKSSISSGCATSYPSLAIGTVRWLQLMSAVQ